MSHIRNLLLRPSGHEHIPSTVPTTMVAEPDLAATNYPARIENVATTVPELPTLRELAVEKAHLSPQNRLAYYDNPRSQAADRFRLLRMRLKEHWSAGKLKKLLITGPLAHDGKSTVVLNLATALAERGKRKVLVVEADLHHSSLAKTLGLSPWAGLTECMLDESTPALSAIRRIEPFGWYFLPAGEPRRNPTELLQSPAFGNIMQKLSPCFDWILIDSPPVIPLTDSLSLQQHADASLLVVRAGKTPREAVEQTITLLGKQNIVGIVLNGVETRNHLYYQYYDGNRDYPED